MAHPIKKLVGQTAVYGLSSIVGRLLNYLLVPFITRAFLPDIYGVVVELYAYVGFLLVLLTYGMETGFFRFAEKTNNSNSVFSTALAPLFVTSTVFILAFSFLAQPIANLIQHPDNKEYIIIFAFIIGIDAFVSLPFAKLRHENKALKFAAFKLIGISLNIVIQLFFVVICKENSDEFLANFHISGLRHLYNPEIGVGYIFIANLIASIFTLILFVPDLIKVKYSFSKPLLKKMLAFSVPLLFVGLAGMANETIDRILLKYLIVVPPGIDDHAEYVMTQVGIYGGVFKISILMTLFTQAFRYAAEPFFFAQEKEVGAKKVYADVMKYFIIFGLIIFLGVLLFLDIFKFFVGKEYWEGLYIIPILLAANLFLGIIYNLSFWYKLTDKTKYGAYIAGIGALITILFNFILIPKIGYLGSAWGHLACYFTMMIISFFLGRKYYRINYPLKDIFIYVLAALIIYFGSLFIELEGNIKYLLNTGLITGFLTVVVLKEKLHSKILKR
ncbi:MAG: polysaccharide biosynthesis C-terminal domain-containing protein [Bacteroidales bacterium]|nr:polysaccharide biosynthesis C-terminal domain-containing protein [Bacteroidales bacterium]